MRDNWNLNIRGEKVLLVPFTKDLVEKYHGWMQDPYLLEMTGSEPLTLQEEYEMQEDWRQDENKCTFIMKTKDALTGEYVMVGDMNLFLCRSGDPAPGALVAEINVMVAEERFRKCGLAMETILMTMHYGVKRLGIDRFMCKIQENNEASRCLFLRLGFHEINYVAAFKEYEYVLDLGTQPSADIRQNDILRDLRALCGVTSVTWLECKDADSRRDNLHSDSEVDETVFSITS